MNIDGCGGKALTWTITALLVLVFLLGVPFGIVLLITVIAAPAVAEQVRLDPCSTQPAGTSNVTGLPAPDGARRASLHNPALPIPERVKDLYMAAASRYRLPWQLIAGVGMEETGHGRNNHTSSAGAQGLMQFKPATFARYGIDGNNDGRRDIHNDADSILSAAHYLVATGAHNGTAGIRRALFAYNHATWYVNDVLHYANRYTNATTGGVCDPALAIGPLPNGPGGPCPASHSAAERGLKRYTLRMLRCVKHTFPWITSMGGVGPRPNVSDHPSGHAVDFMIPKWHTRAGNTRGWQVARWLQRNAASLKVKYIIFDNKVWRAYAPSRGWARYTHPNGSSNPTLRHENHVHCSTY